MIDPDTRFRRMTIQQLYERKQELQGHVFRCKLAIRRAQEEREEAERELDLIFAEYDRRGRC